MRKNSLFFLGAAAGVCLTLLFTGPQGAQLVAAAKAMAGADTYSHLNLFGEVFERVRTDYVEKPDDAKLVEGAIDGMITSLDPHSRYMNDSAWREMQETTHGEFGGLGIEVTMEDGLVKVVAPMDGTPAAKAGIMSGDLITQIDDEAVQGLTLEQAVNKMKGPIDTKTRLTVLRKGAESPINVTIVREIIHVRPVSYHIDGGNIGYIRISSFNEQTADELKKAIGDISKQIASGEIWPAMSSTCATTRVDCSIRRSPCQARSWPGARSSRRGAAGRRKPSALRRGVETSPRANRSSF